MTVRLHTAQFDLIQDEVGARIGYIIDDVTDPVCLVIKCYSHIAESSLTTRANQCFRI